MINLDLLSPEQVTRLDELVAGASRIVILGHSRPDGDALGSSLAWSEYLGAHYGKASQVIVPNSFPDFLHWLPGVERVMRHDKHPEEVERLMRDADLAFCLDFNAVERLEGLAPALAASKAPRVLIDHHLNPTVYPDLSSTSEIVFRMVWQLGGFERLSKKFAVPVYCGMMTDTGAFTYNSSRPEIFFIIGELLTKGIDKDAIYNRVNHNYSVWAIRMRGYIMYQKLNVYAEEHASFFSLTREEMTKFHFVKGDAEGLVNEPLKIKNMKLSISLREDTVRDNLIWVSLRSGCGFHCKEMAERFFNGGGHADAAGGKLTCNMDEAEQTARLAIKAYATELR